MSSLFAASDAWQLGDALLLTLEIFLFVIWVWIFITIVVDLFRDHELSGWGKAIWLFFLIILPFISALIYLIARGGGMQERAIKEQQALQQATDQYIRSVSASPADDLHKLQELKEKGALTDAEFDAAKAKILSGS